MKSLLGSLVFIPCIAVVGCGGGTKGPAGNGGGGGSSVVGPGTGGAPGSGGSPALVGGGGSPAPAGNGGSTVSSGGAGGSSPDADAIRADVADSRVANADQASSSHDAMAGANSCPEFTPCGGDVVGTWYVQSECLADVNPLLCVGFEISFELPGPTLVFTFNADRTFSMSRTGTMRERVRYPLGCLHSDAGAAETCSNLEETVRQSIAAMGDAGTSTLVPTSFSCSADSDLACICDAGYSMPPFTATGTYTTSGNQFTATPLAVDPLPDGGLGDAGAAEPVDYCVSGDTFKYRGRNSSNDSTVIVTMTKLPG